MRSIRALLGSLVDYAGLYPPAGLAMAPAVENYARDRAGELAWMQGRFIVGSKRLREFSSAAAPLMPGTFATSGYREHAATHSGDHFAPWRLSVLLDGVSGAEGDHAMANLETDLQTIEGFNRHHADLDHGLAVIDCVEVKPANADMIDLILDELPEGIAAFFEVPCGASGDGRGMIAALSGGEASAKVRTGGLVHSAFPSPRDLAEFIEQCRLAGVSFKATAGLHHPLRAVHPITSDRAGPTALMHGFLNVFLAAAFAHAHGTGAAGGGQGFDVADIEALLAESTHDAFTFRDDAIVYKRWTLSTEQIAAARSTFALSFGSCSFDEPADDLRGLRLL